MSDISQDAAIRTHAEGDPPRHLEDLATALASKDIECHA